ncbi:MAG: AAA family ATPase [Planctomycetota bacterium]
MYEAFFGLKRRPFAATPDPQCFLASGTIQAALDEVVVCVEQGQGIAVVSAPAGTGKTLLCERLCSELGERFESVLLRHASFLTRRALLQTILCELNHSYRQQDEQELRLELSPAIRALRPQREALVLICDEAHQLSEELLEELRILSDLAEHGRPLVRLVLVGQLGLEETLALSSLEALSQRIRAHVCLETLNRVGSLDYIDYRLTWAGGRTDEIFTAEALELVSRAADGVPRCLNQLCDHALLLAYVAEQQPVPAELIREALQDLRQLPLHWNESSLTEPARRETASFETDPEFEDRAPEVGTFDDGRSTEPASFEMESIEIGADLPQAGHSRVETIIEQSNSEAEAASSIIETQSESSDADEPREAMNVHHEGVRGETMIETPSCWEFGAANLAIVTAGPVACTLQRSPLPGGFIEELVVDRYAAIDAGLEPTELIAPDTATSQEVHSTATFESQETVEPLSMSSEIDPIEMVEVSALESPTTEMATSEPSDLRLNADFDEVCERLDELLPQVGDDAGWDSASLHAENTTFETNDSTATPVMEAANRIVESRSMEDELGNEVCQLAEQLQELLGQPRRENSPVEQLRSLLSPSAEEEFTGMGGVELDADSDVESSSTSAVETSQTTIEPAPSVRPYRNLFSMLRRKQQGLL